MDQDNYRFVFINQRTYTNYLNKDQAILPTKNEYNVLILICSTDNLYNYHRQNSRRLEKLIFF